KRAFDLLYSGRRFSASDALDMNLVNQVVPAAALDGAVADYVRMLKRKDRTAVGLGRRAYYAMVPMTPASRLQYAQTFLATLLRATDGAVPHADDDHRIADEHRCARARRDLPGLAERPRRRRPRPAPPRGRDGRLDPRSASRRGCRQGAHLCPR